MMKTRNIKPNKIKKIGILISFLLIGSILLVGSNTLTAQTTKPEDLIQSLFEAFNKTDLKKLDELTASPFIFVVGNKISITNTYSEAVDFDAIKKTGWGYSKINSSEILYEDKYSSQVHISFSRFNKNDEVMSTNDVIYTLILNNSNWKIKSAVIVGHLTL